MTAEEIRTITADRFARWAHRCVDSHATPVLTVAIGHDAVSGDLVLCTLDEPDLLPDATLALMLRRAAKMLERP